MQLHTCLKAVSPRPTNAAMQKKSFKRSIADYATATLGFDDCRFTGIETGNSTRVYEQWLKDGCSGTMAYLKKHRALKSNPRLLLPGARSAIVVIKNYKNTLQQHLTQKLKISRYAVGADYHHVIAARLKKIEDYIAQLNPAIQWYSGVDSKPIFERGLAVKAGVGFLGKNAMVIRPGMGSYFFIGIVLTTADIEPDAPLTQNCGSCRRCIDACPAGAIRNDRTVDAVKCTSYKNIERTEPLTEKEIARSRGWLFGCDICQEACPHNRDSVPLTDWDEFLPGAGVGFDFFDTKKCLVAADIPRDSALYRSRSRIVVNFRTARALLTTQPRSKK